MVFGAAFQPLRGQGGSIIVTTLADSGNGSLRAALASANDGDVITFAVSGTITNLSGELLINRSLAIVGPGPNNLAVSGNNSSRVFNLYAGAAANLSGLTICDGHAHDGADRTNSADWGWAGDGGGGIYNSGTLVLTNCVVTRCRSGQGGAGFSYSLVYQSPGCSEGGQGGDGGGIYNIGTLTLAACTVSSNTAGSGGSGGNTQFKGYAGGAGGSGGRGGGIYIQNNSTLVSCTFACNAGGSGGSGGLGGYGYNSQVYPARPAADGNKGGDGGMGGTGGGLICESSFRSVACTFIANSAGTGGNGGPGGAGGQDPKATGGKGGAGGNGGNSGGGGGASAGGFVSLQNTLVAQNTAPAGGPAGVGGAGGRGFPAGSSGANGAIGLAGWGPDLFGVFDSNGHNLIGLGDGSYGFTDGILAEIVGSGTPLNALVGPLAGRYPSFAPQGRTCVNLV